MDELKEIFKTIDTMMISCEIDYVELLSQKIDESYFGDYSNVRIINSFLFNYSKIQDKIGSKLLRKVLFAQKELDSENVAMKDVINLMERLGILVNAHDWDRLREIRNNLSHEYPFCIQERIENIKLAIEGYDLLKTIYFNLKKYCEL